MNPYLESPSLWEGVHARLVVEIANQLQPALDPRYIASVEERVFIESPSSQRVPDVFISHPKDSQPRLTKDEFQPSIDQCDTAVIIELDGVEIHQRFIEILDTYNGMKLVTIIELLSPSNKRAGAGERSYRAKQMMVIESDCHFVEIDLLRTGNRVLSVPDWKLQELGDFDYIACVSRAEHRNRFELYPVTLATRLPRIAIPLAGEDKDIPLNLQLALEQVITQGRYEKRIRYEEPCDPPLSEKQKRSLSS